MVAISRRKIPQNRATVKTAYAASGRFRTSIGDCSRYSCPSHPRSQPAEYDTRRRFATTHAAYRKNVASRESSDTSALKAAIISRLPNRTPPLRSKYCWAICALLACIGTIVIRAGPLASTRANSRSGTSECGTSMANPDRCLKIPTSSESVLRSALPALTKPSLRPTNQYLTVWTWRDGRESRSGSLARLEAGISAVNSQKGDSDRFVEISDVRVFELTSCASATLAERETLAFSNPATESGCSRPSRGGALSTMNVSTQATAAAEPARIETVTETSSVRRRNFTYRIG